MLDVSYNIFTKAWKTALGCWLYLKKKGYEGYCKVCNGYPFKGSNSDALGKIFEILQRGLRELSEIAC